MLRLASLGSGSKGNATLVASQDTVVLIDCGFGVREINQKCLRLTKKVKLICFLIGLKKRFWCLMEQWVR